MVEGADAKALVNVIAPALRGLLGRTGEPLKFVTFDASAPVVDLVGREGGRELVMGGPLTPDQIVYCRSFPLWVRDGAGRDHGRLEGAPGRRGGGHPGTYQGPPTVVLVEGWACSQAGTRGRTPTRPAWSTSTR